MWELMPETWLRDEEENEEHAGSSAAGDRTSQISSSGSGVLLAWLGILLQRYPHMVLELIAYRATIS